MDRFDNKVACSEIAVIEIAVPALVCATRAPSDR